LKEIKTKQSLTGKRAAITKEFHEKENFKIDIKDPKFLELYGALLGDGWVSKNNGKNKWIIGICGHRILDENYILYLRENILRLLNRSGYLSRREKYNTIMLVFRHKIFWKYITDRLGFPKGKKINLKLPEAITELSFDLKKNVIRGIFDTDGTFFLEKRKVEPHYPRISIHINSPQLIKQIGEILTKEGFKLSYADKGTMLCLRGKQQLFKWMDEIGISNKKHRDRINKYLRSA
jgi:hypothetical protein